MRLNRERFACLALIASTVIGLALLAPASPVGGSAEAAIPKNRLFSVLTPGKTPSSAVTGCGSDSR